MNLLPADQTKEKRFKINFSLTPAQAEIERLSKRFTHIRAGRKFGKTKYSEWKALQWMSKPNSCHWHIAPTYKQARLISWTSFKRMIPKEAVSKVNDSDLFIQLKNGSQLFLMGSDDRDTLRGPSPTSMTLEEAAYHKGDVWQEVLEPNLLVHKGPALFISSPRGFNWFKDLEDESNRLNSLGDSDWATFHFTIYDNPYIDKAEIERIRRSTDPMVWRQEYMAEYESAVGRVFNVFQDNERHVREVDVPHGTFEAYRAIDWGMRDDCAALWARVLGNKVHIYREHAENGLGATAQAKIILGKTPRNETILKTAISHDAVREDANMQGLTVLWHMMNAGIKPIQPSSRNKDKSRSMIQELLQEDRLVIDPSCTKLRKQLLSYEWKDSVVPMEKTADGNDDLVDALHYLVELVQFGLFMAGRVEVRKTPLELAVAHQKEVEDRMARPFRDKVNGYSEEMVLPLDNTPAGYL